MRTNFGSSTKTWQMKKRVCPRLFFGLVLYNYGVLTISPDMALFSQRKGLKPLQVPLQREAVDLPLRNLLWSALNEVYWTFTYESSGYFPSQKAQSVRL